MFFCAKRKGAGEAGCLFAQKKILMNGVSVAKTRLR